MPPKESLSAIAIGLTFVAFFPYIRSIFQGKTRPHLFSWIIWAITTLIVFLAQLEAKGGAGAWPVGVSAMITIYIALLAWTRSADTSITGTDWLFLLSALASLPLWYLTADPVWAVVLLTTIDILGFGPTVRKVYRFPFEENTAFFILFSLRNGLVILALESYSLTTVLFPLAVGIACVLLLALIGCRRRALATEKTN